MATPVIDPFHHIDLENGTNQRRRRRRRRRRNHHHLRVPSSPYFCEMEEGEIVCFSDREDDGVDDNDASTYSYCSQFYSTTGGSIDGCSFSLPRISSASESGGGGSLTEIKVESEEERECRICHMSLVRGEVEEEVEEDQQVEEEVNELVGGSPIVLGCSCKEDLGVAHKNCAESWFKIRGNKTCEICNCTAQNLVDVNESPVSTDQNSNDNGNSVAATTESPAMATASPAEMQRFWQSQKFLNYVLGCMALVFALSWLFHFRL